MEDQAINTPVRLLCSDPDRLALIGGRPIPAWVNERFRSFHSMVMNKREVFPCYFATIGEEAGVLRYSYLEAGELRRPVALSSSLVAFLSQRRPRRPRSALIVFVAATGTSEEDHRVQFWDLLQALHDLDKTPWPESIPSDPDDPDWSFCFHGTPIFVAGHSPHYRNRLSRKTERDLFLVIQPRSNLAGITGRGRTADRVRQRIRGSLCSYDSVAPSPELGVYGDPDSREWRQYWLSDDNSPTEDPCPLSISPGRKAA